MAEATPQQIQNFADQLVRPHAELMRSLVLALDYDRASIDDVYEALTGSQSGWADARTDGPPHLLDAASILSFNTFAEDVRTYIKNHGEYANVLRACVREP